MELLYSVDIWGQPWCFAQHVKEGSSITAWISTLEIVLAIFPWLEAVNAIGSWFSHLAADHAVDPVACFVLLLKIIVAPWTVRNARVLVNVVH